MCHRAALCSGEVFHVELRTVPFCVPSLWPRLTLPCLGDGGCRTPQGTPEAQPSVAFCTAALPQISVPCCLCRHCSHDFPFAGASLLLLQGSSLSVFQCFLNFFDFLSLEFLHFFPTQSVFWAIGSGHFLELQTPVSSLTGCTETPTRSVRLSSAHSVKTWGYTRGATSKTWLLHLKLITVKV